MVSSENKLFRKNTWKNIMFLRHYLTLRMQQKLTERAISEGGRQGREQLTSKIMQLMQLSNCKEAVHSGTEEAQEWNIRIRPISHKPSCQGTLETVSILMPPREPKRALTCKWRHHAHTAGTGTACVVPQLVASKGITWSPLCSINLNKPSLSLATLKYSLLSLPTSTAGGPNYLAQCAPFMPYNPVLQLLLWRKGYLREKKTPT